MFKKIPMTFTELKRRLDRSSDNDRLYERPMNWTEAEELLMIYEQTRKEVERLEEKITVIAKQVSEFCIAEIYANQEDINVAVEVIRREYESD